MRLIDFFDRLYIIHLPERTDRYQALKNELANIGIDIKNPKVILPKPPYPSDTNDFYSIGVYSNFIRHLGILKECLENKVERFWILEDDAIFRHQLRHKKEQEKLIQLLKQDNWDLCFIGHNISSRQLRSHQRGLTQFTDGFMHAHCYCVHPRVLPKLVQYFEETLINPPGHPRGGRLYIDGAFNMFRQLHPDIVCLVSNPCLSVQKGSPSSLASMNWFDHYSVTQPLISSARSLRDEIWRLNWI